MAEIIKFPAARAQDKQPSRRTKTVRAYVYCRKTDTFRLNPHMAKLEKEGWQRAE